jgi:hypothetical protein
MSMYGCGAYASTLSVPTAPGDPANDLSYGINQLSLQPVNDVQPFPRAVLMKYKPPIWILVCNADHTNRHPDLVDADKSGTKLINYLIELIKVKDKIDPSGPFLLFISEFSKKFTKSLHDRLTGMYDTVDCFPITADQSDYNAIFVFKNNIWVQDKTFGNRNPIDGVEEDPVGKYMAVLMTHQPTGERLLCIFVHLPHRDRSEKELAWDALRNRLQMAKDDPGIKYVVVAGDFNAEPDEVSRSLILYTTGEQQPLLAIPSNRPTNKSETGLLSSIDNFVTLGPIAANVTLMNYKESKLSHFPMYGWLQFFG